MLINEKWPNLTKMIAHRTKAEYIDRKTLKLNDLIIELDFEPKDYALITIKRDGQILDKIKVTYDNIADAVGMKYTYLQSYVVRLIRYLDEFYEDFLQNEFVVIRHKRCERCEQESTSIMRSSSVNSNLSEDDIYQIISSDVNSPYISSFCDICEMITLQKYVGWKILKRQESN